MYWRQSRKVRVSHGLCSISNKMPSYLETLKAIAESISGGEKAPNAFCPCSRERITPFNREPLSIVQSPRQRIVSSPPCLINPAVRLPPLSLRISLRPAAH